jgi:hypothetical protein
VQSCERTQNSIVVNKESKLFNLFKLVLHLTKMKGQNKNIPGILAALRVTVQPSIAVPHLVVPGNVAKYRRLEAPAILPLKFVKIV